MHKALLILGGIEDDSVLGQRIPLEGFLEPRYLPDARCDLTDGNVRKVKRSRVGTLLIAFASLD
jgi:hypothetical protein